jgi:hypothetical protein
MALSSRIRRHLQSHVVGYIALFVALSGTALALPGTNKVKKNDIARGAVTGKAIAAAAVAREKLRNNAVTSSKLDAGAVIETALADGAVTTPKLRDDAVTRSKIGQGEINGGKLANGSVNSAKVADGELLATDFATGQLSDGFRIAGEQGQFSIARAGPVFLVTTFIASCDTDPQCVANQYETRIDGVEVPGTEINLTQNDGDPGEVVTLVGLSAPLAPGTHDVDLVTDDGLSTEASINHVGVLLQ